MHKAAVLALGLTLVAGAAQAQQKASDPNPAVSGYQQMYAAVKGYITKAADQVPEEKYAFQPTKDVRTFGQLVGHIVDAQSVVCAAIKGESREYSAKAEKIKSKADMVAALKASFAECDAAYAGATDASLGQAANPFGMSMNVSGALALNTSHDWEHYGNIVTYMRMIGMVPPSSQN